MTMTLFDVRESILNGLVNPVLYDLGCGQTPEDGFVGMDYSSPLPNVRQADLYRFPWPIESASVDYFRASHFVEHVPDWDAHFAEVYRCLKPGGHYEIVAPFAWNDRYLQDPTHRQPITQARFAYLSWDWLVAQKNEHFRPRMNFSMVQWFELLNPDYDNQGFSDYELEHAKRHFINVVDDIATILRKELMPDERAQCDPQHTIAGS